MTLLLDGKPTEVFPMSIMVKKGQSVEATDDFYFLSGVALRDWDDEGEDQLTILDSDDGMVLKIRTDLATSIVVDGVEIIDML